MWELHLCLQFSASVLGFMYGAIVALVFMLLAFDLHECRLPLGGGRLRALPSLGGDWLGLVQIGQIQGFFHVHACGAALSHCIVNYLSVLLGDPLNCQPTLTIKGEGPCSL